MLVDKADEFFIQPAYSLPESKPDGSAWSEEERTYHDWQSAFGVGGLLLDGRKGGRGAINSSQQPPRAPWEVCWSAARGGCLQRVAHIA